MADADFSVKAIISAQTSQFEKGIKNAQSSVNSISKSIENVNKLLKTAFSVVGVTVGIKAVTDFGKSCVQSANEAVKTFNILDNTVKATGADAWTSTKKLEDVSKSLSDSTNYSVTEIQNMQSVLLGFTNITGETFDEASKAVLDMATVMKMDLTSAVQTVGKALDDPITGLDSLRRQGFKFTDQQKQQLKYLVENGDKIKAQKIILDTLATSYGGAATAGQDSFAKQRHAMEDFQDALGIKLIPVMQVFAESNSEMLNSLTNLLNKLDFSIVIDFLEQTKQLFSDFTNENEGLFSGIIDEDDIYNILNGIYKAVQICVNSINAIIHGDWETVWDYAKLVVLKLVNSVSEALQKMVDDLGLKVNVAAGIIGGLATGFGIFTGNIAVAAAGVGVAVGTILATNKAAMEKVTADIQSEIDETEKDIIARTHKNAQDGGQQLLRDLQRTSTGVKAEAEETGEVIVENLNPPTSSTKNNFFTRFAKDAKGAFTAINKIVKESVKKTKDAFTDTVDEEERQAEREQDIARTVAAMKEDLSKGIQKTYGEMFSFIGQEMVKGEAGWEDYAAVAVQGIAQILQALGAELIALAASRAANYDFGTAAVAATAAAAAFVASGVLTAVSSAMKSSADTTDLATDSIDNWQSSIESLHDTITDLVESAVDFNGFITAVTQADDMIAAATSNYEKAVKQLENFAAELEVLEGLIEIQNFSLFGGGDNWWDKLSHLQQQYLLIQQKKLQDQIKGTVKEIEEAERIIEDAIDTITDSVYEQNEELKEQEELLKSIYSGEWLDVGKVITKQQQLLHLNESLVSTLAEFVNLGEDIGDTLLDSLNDSLSSTEFLSTIKKTIRTNLLKIAVYTDEMRAKLAKVGTKLAEALSGQTSLTEVRSELNAIWEEASKSATEAEKIIEEAFGDIADVVDDTTESITDSLTTFEQAMQDFKETIADTGGSIANEIVNGLTDGLSQSDFLSKMQTWLRNNLIQMVVYTDSMKSEIQAISDKIAEIMGSGRMFTTDELHEIRRDLSYAYESATSRMGTIDEILSSVFSGYATGTQNATAGLHLVGEAGPELVRFSGGEQVFNANETKDILSGGNMGNNFNVTFVNTQDTTAIAMMNQLRQYNRELAINGIL